jgi:phosphoenolpyruvate phosphomutase
LLASASAQLITKLESRGIAGVCLEDKLFPKTNSFIDGELQPLADIHEFCGKIMACKDTQKDDDFNVVARLEAFITGHGLDEAYKRAEAYHKAGADAILCHSKKAVSHASTHRLRLAACTTALSLAEQRLAKG